jgi:hypothetical protein
MTDFISDNVRIVTAIMLGGILGYASGSFAGCGLGGIGGAGTGAASRFMKNKPFKTPNLPKKTRQWLASKIESPQEKLMSVMLAKDIKTIQVYQLKKKLKRRSAQT